MSRSLRFVSLSLVTSILFVGTGVGLSGCSQNAFLESAKKDTDAALLFEAKKLMNKSNWSDAITLIAKMSTAGRDDRGTKAVLASAYAGKCGLNLIRLADKISNSASQNFFSVLMSGLPGSTAASVADCVSAENTLRSISDVAAERTADENVMLAFIGFAKIGAILTTYADTNGDGTPDPGFDSCNTAMLPDAMLREVGTGVTLAVSALAAAGGSIGAGLSDAVTNACANLATADPAYDFCTVTTAASFSVDQTKALGGLVKSTDNPGIGTCAGSISACVCP
ncbi:hypothetical protein BH10BDE1_BH10BDE1_07240 [soil metagenome]